ncbi:MAG: ECF transporter S component [Lachnospiraceae bacterium]|nr:ECF transporter S component [Lachnospiraceae bacterium]
MKFGLNRMLTLLAAENEGFFAKLKKTAVAVGENVGFILVFLAIIVALFLIAYCLEVFAQKKNGVKEKIFTPRKMAFVGIFSAVSAVLMLFEIVMPFAPSFYKLDFSEIPILIGTFAFGPAAGVMMEFVKIFLKLIMKGSSTAFVGELANFAVGCSFILPASLIYTFKKSKKSAIIACGLGTVILTIFGTAFNAIYLLPAFAKLYGMPLEAILGMGSKVNSLVKEGSIISFVVWCVAPLNLIKGVSVSIITMLVYKPLSPIIKGITNRERKQRNK